MCQRFLVFSDVFCKIQTKYIYINFFLVSAFYFYTLQPYSSFPLISTSFPVYFYFLFFLFFNFSFFFIFFLLLYVSFFFFLSLFFLSSFSFFFQALLSPTTLNFFFNPPHCIHNVDNFISFVMIYFYPWGPTVATGNPQQ